MRFSVFVRPILKVVAQFTELIRFDLYNLDKHDNQNKYAIVYVSNVLQGSLSSFKGTFSYFEHF